MKTSWSVPRGQSEHMGPKDMRQSLRYAAFISYSHMESRGVAGGLQKWLQTYAKPWWRWRAVDVFRDETNLTAAPALWSRITAALDDSSHFILLASPKAAQSKWVKRELRHWLGERDVHELEGIELDAAAAGIDPAKRARLLFVLTEGQIVWDEATDDFDRDKTDALPQLLSGVFPEEPQWVDLKSVIKNKDLRQSLSRSNPDFMLAVAQLAAPIRGIDDFSRLVSEDFAQHKRTMLTAWAAAITLLVIAIVAAYQREAAVREKDQALVNQSVYLAEESIRQTESGDATLGWLLARQALPMNPQIPDRPLVGKAAGSLMTAVFRSRERIVTGTGEGPFNMLAVSAYGPRFVTMSSTTKLWNSEDGTKVAELTGHTGQVTRVTFSPDGKYLLTAASDGARLWNTSNGDPINAFTDESWSAPEFDHDSSVFATAAHTSVRHAVTIRQASNGRRLKELPLTGEILAITLMGNDSNVKIVEKAGYDIRLWTWNWRTADSQAKSVNLPHSNGVNRAEFSPSGRRLLTISMEGTGVLWDPEIGQVLSQLPQIGETSWSLDSRWLIDGSMKVWNAENGMQQGLGFPALEGPLNSAAFSPDGRMLASVADSKWSDRSSTIALWNMSDNGQELQLLTSLRSEDERFTNISFTSDGRKLISSAPDGKIHIWDAVSGRRTIVLQGHSGPLESAWLSPDGDRVLTSSFDGSARIWYRSGLVFRLGDDAESGRIMNAIFNSDGSTVFTVRDDGEVQTWDSVSGFKRKLVVRGGNSPEGESTRFLSISGNDEVIVTGTGSGRAEIRDAKTGRLYKSVLHDGPGSHIISMMVDYRGKRVLTASQNDNVVKIWSVQNSDVRLLVHDRHSSVTAAKFSPDGQYIVTAAQGNVTPKVSLWNAEDGSIIWQKSFIDISDVSFSGDMRYIAVAGSDSGITILRSANGDRTDNLRVSSLEAEASRVEFFPDSNCRLIASYWDGAVRLWSIGHSAGAENVTFRGHRQVVRRISFSEDGRRVVTAGNDNFALVYDLFSSVKELLEYGSSEAVRELNDTERSTYGLISSGPEHGWRTVYNTLMREFHRIIVQFAGSNIEEDVCERNRKT